MNNRILSLTLTLLCASSLIARAQDPPGCATTAVTHTKKHLLNHKPRLKGRLPKGKPLHQRKRHTTTAVEPDNFGRNMPVIASPIYMPQTNGGNAAITASNGYLYVVVGQKLYKVDQATL